MNEVCDFANSYLTFELRGVNSARINLDARCEWVDVATGEREEFVLICPCQAEKMYLKQDFIQDPPYNFLGVFSRTQSHIIRQFADASVMRDTVELHQGRFDSVKIDLAPFRNAVELTRDKDIVDATLRNLPLIGRTEMASRDGRSRAVMEYPITTMNVEPGNARWQVDTGPALFADFGRDVAERIEKMIPGFIVYNTREYAGWALRTAVRLPKGDATHHFADVRSGAVRSGIYAGLPLQGPGEEP